MKWQCALLQRWLPEHPDGELSAFWRRRLQAHVEGCAVCRQELAAMREMEQAIREVPVADPGPEFWNDFSREMHLKLVQAVQEGKPAPAPARSAWWAWHRVPYLVGIPALVVLLIWVAVSYQGRRVAGLSAPQVAQQESAAKKEKVAAAPQAPAYQEPKKFIYVSRTGGNESADFVDPDDLDATLSNMTPQQKEAFLRRLSEHQKDGSCLKESSLISLA